jgi:hypothetical protein
MKPEPLISAGVATATATRRSVDAVSRQEPLTPTELAAEVVGVLAAMTYEERVRAYRSGAFSAHELAVAAAGCPKEVPILNDEYEWIAINAE